MTEVVNGVRLGVAQAGIKRVGHDDTTVIALDSGTRVSAVFTQNAFRAAPVLVAEAHIETVCEQQPVLEQAQGVRYLLINTGNANAGTGTAGLEHARASCSALADLAGCDAEAVLPFSTGVIGEPLPIVRLIAALPEALEDLRVDGWSRAAAAILTTDTRAKCRSQRVALSTGCCVITGMAKGAGMICPNMATMLAFIATDAQISQSQLDDCFKRAIAASFNRISVDGDTSTNDAAVLCATGLGPAVSEQCAEDLALFEAALTTLCIELAQDIVRDGEGATKFVTVAVSGGLNTQECDQVGYTIAHSPLVKTALFASDPNWGRLLAAIGRAGLTDLNVAAVSVRINDVLIAENGARAAQYTEADGVAAMAPSELTIAIDLGRGEAQATIWTTDLSYDYVKINAEYRT